MFHIRTTVFTMFVVALFASLAIAAERDQANVDGDHVGIKGYDPVAYFDGAAKEGDPKITADHNGVTYRFATDANREKFKSDPDHFAPACGGWCAYAFAVDKGKVDIDPKSYKITDGRLFLFYKGWRGDALKEWLKDEANYIPKADVNWKKTAGE